MLLVQIKISGVTRYISNEMISIEHSYKPWIESITAPSWQMDTEYGGMVKFGYGGITISPGLFQEIGVWPPQLQCDISVYYTASTEAASTLLFESEAHLVSFDSESVQYDIRDKPYLQKLLTEGTNYEGDSVAFPMAFGTVTHVTPTRIANDGDGLYVYRLGGIQTGGVAKQIAGFTLSGSSTKVITDLDHGYNNGDTVYIGGSDNYDTDKGEYISGHVISGKTDKTFIIPVTFADEQLPLNAQCWKAGQLSVFEDGVGISENAIINGDDTFTLAYQVEGKQKTICGTGADTTLDEVAEYCADRLNLSYVNTYARSPSPSVARWETSQQTVVDFLSKICASFTHLFYIKDGDLVLVDMFKSNGDRTLTEFQFFRGVRYQKFNPVKKLLSEWTTHSAAGAQEYDDYQDRDSHFIQADDNFAEELMYDYGDEISIEAFHEKKSNVLSALVCIRVVYESDKATISIPFGASLPVPGERLTWTDSNVPIAIPGYIRARDINFDFGNEEVQITGEGLFINTYGSNYTGEGTISGATTDTIDRLDMALGQGCIWRYVITNADRSSMRGGGIQAVWDQAAGGNVSMVPDKSTPDIGTTIGVISFGVNKAATTVRLRATSTGGDWTIYTVRTIIGAA